MLTNDVVLFLNYIIMNPNHGHRLLLCGYYVYIFWISLFILITVKSATVRKLLVLFNSFFFFLNIFLIIKVHHRKKWKSKYRLGIGQMIGPFFSFVSWYSFFSDTPKWVDCNEMRIHKSGFRGIKTMTAWVSDNIISATSHILLP